MASPQPDPTPLKFDNASGEGLGETYFYDSVGTTLRKRRQELELTVQYVARQTKIQRKYLEAIEANDWTRLAHSVHTLGFVRQYAKLLGLDSQVASTKYLLERGPLLGAASQQRRRFKPAIVGSRIAMRVAIATVLLGVVIYLGWQLSILAAPPPLEITDPATDQQTNTQSIEIRGQTSPSVSVTVNNAAVVVDNEGRFSTTVDLSEGLNVIEIEARSRAGKTSRVQRSILVNS